MKAEEIAEKEYPYEESGMYVAYREGFVKGYNYDKWIKCSERLPEKEYAYNVYVTNIGVGVLCFSNGVWTMPLHKTILIEDVTHWQPLPNKPTEL